VNGKNLVVEIDGKKLVGAANFHDSFATVFGFPEYYGRNMDAWIDCMSYLDEPGAGMTEISVPKGKSITIKIENYTYFKTAAPDQWLDLLECSAFVNSRCSELGINSLIALAFQD
jgi:hypothetical protein